MLAALFVLLAGAYALRTAAVRAYAEKAPSVAETFWSGHPKVLAAIAMAEVGEAAARGERPWRTTLDRLDALAVRAPLQPEPFLVNGAAAFSRGKQRYAEQLLLDARMRAPRSLAGRYLLADLLLRENRVAEALDELAVLTRINPSFVAPVGPALTDYAKSPGAVPHLRWLFRDNPQLENSILNKLSSDAKNADLILSLAHKNQSEAPIEWQQRLVSTLVSAGEYRSAHQLSRRFGLIPNAEESFAFQRAPARSPFSWVFGKGSAGSAEPVNGRLDVMFTGIETITLASKIALLPPGFYEMRMAVDGDTPPSVRWIITCLRNKESISQEPLSSTRSNWLSVRFQITPACPAQQFELRAEGETYPQSAEFVLGGPQVNRVSPN